METPASTGWQAVRGRSDNGEIMASNFGFVYVLGIDSMPNIYKVGMTKRTTEERCVDLSASTSCATPFYVLAEGFTASPGRVERQIHEDHDLFRINDRREFFRADLCSLVAEIRRHCGEVSVSQKGLEVMRERENEMRKNFFKFSGKTRESDFCAWMVGVGATPLRMLWGAF